jgi:hypothetical protein
VAKSWSEAYKETLRSVMNDKADDIATGSAQDFPDYRYRVGVIEGLALAEREFLDIIERIERAEDG